MKFRALAGTGLLLLGLWRAVAGVTSRDDGRTWYGLGLVILFSGAWLVWSVIRSPFRLACSDVGEGLAFFGLWIVGLSIWPFTQMRNDQKHTGIWIGSAIGTVGLVLFILGLCSVMREQRRKQRN